MAEYGEDYEAGTSRMGSMFKGENFRAIFSTVLTLTLAIMGSALLPVAWAFSITGIVAGFSIGIAVMVANVYTSDLLIRQTYFTRMWDYESLCYSVGGVVWQNVCQISTVILLGGTIVGGFQQIQEATFTAVTGLIAEDKIPEALRHKDGQLMLIIVLCIFCFPFAFLRNMRSLEWPSALGFLIAVWLVVVVVVQSIGQGLPALKSGDFPKVGFKDPGLLAQCISVLGFAFYLQPMMMPLLAEQPGKPENQARLLSWGMRWTVVVNAGTLYFLISFFGAAWYGTRTEDNILVNRLMGGGNAQAALNLAFAVYLALTVPPLEIPVRRALDAWVPLPKNRFVALRQFVEVVLIYGTTLAIALFWSEGSGKTLVVTGATGVFMSSYFIPVVNHWVLALRLAKCQRNRESMSGYVDRSGDESQRAVWEGQPTGEEKTLHPADSVFYWRKKNVVLAFIFDIIVPALVVGVGAIASAASLWQTFKPNA